MRTSADSGKNVWLHWRISGEWQLLIIEKYFYIVHMSLDEVKHKLDIIWASSQPASHQYILKIINFYFLYAICREKWKRNYENDIWYAYLKIRVSGRVDGNGKVCTFNGGTQLLDPTRGRTERSTSQWRLDSTCRYEMLCIQR